MGNILNEFKSFATRGNATDMAVGIIIGAAFGKIVSSIVDDLIMPVIGILIGGVNFTELKFVLKEAVAENGNTISPAVTLNYGNFIQTSFNFIIIAIAIFVLIKVLNSLSNKQEAAAAAPPATPPADTQLLTEIRDLLKDQQ